MSTPGNSINESTTGITGFSGTAFTGSTTTENVVQLGGASSHLIKGVSGVGTADQVLTSNGPGLAPTWQDVSTIGISGISTYTFWEDFYSVNLDGSNDTDVSTFFDQETFGLSSGAAVGTQDPQTHPGTIQTNTGTATNGGNLIFASGNLIMGGGSIECEWLLYIPTLSVLAQRYTLYLGIHNGTASAAPTDGVYFTYSDTINSGNWVGNTSKASSSSTANSAVAVSAATWIKLKISVNAGATSASFFVNGTEIANSPIATNIPNTVITRPSFSIVKSLGTTSRSFILDYVNTTINLTTPR